MFGQIFKYSHGMSSLHVDIPLSKDMPLTNLQGTEGH